jgi:hypothetical protein
VNCVVCTLFEHHYHVGAAVLVNSLCRSGFAGTVYAGFRGPLPPWAESRVKAVGEGRWEMDVSPKVRVVFLALETEAHFTNYKPDFLFQVERLAGDSEAAIYFDPDIVFNGSWSYLEEWLTCGVALCEDVNSPLARNHPRRIGWRRAFEPLGYRLEFRDNEFVNGGFIGLRWEHRKLLVTWQAFLAHIAVMLGGSDIAGIGGGRLLDGNYGFADCFRQPDQDALNAAAEACPGIPLSVLGAQAMGFKGGDALLPHALGPAKPWRRNYVREALGGVPPSAVDRAFWRDTEGPIRPFSGVTVSAKRLTLTMGAALGRVIRRA